MSLQEMLQALLRSQLYRTRVVIELEGGVRHEGRVAEIRHEGRRSAVLLATAVSGASAEPRRSSAPAELLLAHIVAVRAA